MQVKVSVTQNYQIKLMLICMTTTKFQSPVAVAKPLFENSVVKRALNSILSSTGFCSSPQLSAFLSYVVDQTLDGRGAGLKAYSIATEALGRPMSFDPVTDATVRVLAGRVRSALELYYSRLGSFLILRHSS